MKVPKIFVPENLKEKDIKRLLEVPKDLKIVVHNPKKTRGFKTRKYVPTLESLVPDKRLFKANPDLKYTVSNSFSESYIQKWYDRGVFKTLGINSETIEKKLATMCGNQLVMMFQYKTDKDLTNNFRELFEKGIAYYNNRYDTGFLERFLFKDNISVYIDCSPKLIEDLAKHYGKIGFRQIDYKLKKYKT